ncbi:hypothetical protein HPB47_018031 [Ixodes persulcatus]|uniref:Uncharacterized protein n=1 Tax=Ixodes persulcatus TaxID=34615 RepID=A0AC60QQF9_IXOPE|nr:hypothetical protein HPB47_018031 [Ixodes persulcatus]
MQSRLGGLRTLPARVRTLALQQGNSLYLLRLFPKPSMGRWLPLPEKGRHSRPHSLERASSKERHGPRAAPAAPKGQERVNSGDTPPSTSSAPLAGSGRGRGMAPHSLSLPKPGAKASLQEAEAMDEVTEVSTHASEQDDMESLQNWLQEIVLERGIMITVLKTLKKKMKNWSSKDRTCTLLFDEISLKSNLYYDPKKDRVHGFSDTASENPLRAQKCREQVDFLKFMLSVISEWRFDARRQPHSADRAAILTELRQLPVTSVASSPGPRQDVEDLEKGGSSGDCLTDD